MVRTNPPDTCGAPTGTILHAAYVVWQRLISQTQISRSATRSKSSFRILKPAPSNCFAGSSAEDAQDLTQGFFLHLLDHKALRQVNPGKGKFRSFLLASLQNYLSDQVDSARCLKRGGNIEFVPLDMKSAEDRYRLAPLDFLTADKIFDAQWAMTLLDEAMCRLNQEYAAQGKASMFETLKPFIDPINSKAALSYEQVANTLQVGLGSVKKSIYRLRKRYASVLREEVARTVSDPAELDQEIHALCEALIVAEGRLGP
jgi:DNA-directed RNA polymerase specialized sigma24 family protein